MSNQLTTIPNSRGDSIVAACRAICEPSGFGLSPEDIAVYRDLCLEYREAMLDLERVGGTVVTSKDISDELDKRIEKYLGGETESTGVLKADIRSDRARRRQILKNVADLICQRCMDFAEEHRAAFVKVAEEWISNHVEDMTETYQEFGLSYDSDPLLAHVRLTVSRVGEPLNRALGRMQRPYNLMPFVDYDFAAGE